jgi:hypothetical protein
MGVLCRVTWCVVISDSCNDPCLQEQIIAAVKNVDAPMLTRVRQELEYRIDVCRVTHGAQIERL